MILITWANSTEYAQFTDGHPIHYPPIDRGEEITIFQDGTMKLPNGTHTDGQILVLGTNGTRGFLVNVTDADEWTKCPDCFRSIPRNLKGFVEPEQWFTPAHKHDSSSTEKLGCRDWLMKYGTDTFHITSDDRNISHKLVNTELNIADERGVRFLILDTSSYASSEEMKIIIIQQEWEMSSFWVNNLATVNFIAMATTIYSCIYKVKKDPNYRRYVKYQWLSFY